MPNINQISLLKLLTTKDDTRKTSYNKYFVNIGDIANKSRTNSRSFSKGRKVEMVSLHKDDLDAFDKSRIQIDKRHDKTQERYDRLERQ